MKFADYNCQQIVKCMSLPQAYLPERWSIRQRPKFWEGYIYRERKGASQGGPRRKRSEEINGHSTWRCAR